MGLAASQARLLSLTARIHDVEYQAQMIQSSKLQLATQEDAVYKRYLEALDATTLTFQDTQGNRVKATFNNLCGEGSITNNLAGGKHYTFRDKNDRLLVPSDVYDAYKNYGGSDPYEFAMSMLGVKSKDYDAALEKYEKSTKDIDILSSVQEEIDTMIDGLFSETSYYKDLKAKEVSDDIIEEQKPTIIEDMKKSLNSNGIVGFKKHFDYDNLSDSAKKNINSLGDLMDKYKHKMFTTANGAECIYKEATKEEDFDQEKFDYYLRWGKLIELEYGIDGCTNASDYKNNFENNSEFLQEMLQSGYITIDAISVDNKTGKINEGTTSVPSDSNLEYTTTTSIDKKELAKAEAEYEHAMKEIDRKDKRFDMDLNRLETERTALTTEYDSVKKIIQDNIERTFKIFS